MYNSPPGSCSTDQYNTLIPLLSNLLKKEENYILLDNFNLYYFLQCGPCNLIVHKALDQLVNLILLYNLLLALPKGRVTWEAQGQTSTINLTFLLLQLTEQVVQCKIQENLSFGLNYYLLSTILLLRIILAAPSARRS